MIGLLSTYMEANEMGVIGVLAKNEVHMAVPITSGRAEYLEG